MEKFPIPGNDQEAAIFNQIVEDFTYGITSTAYPALYIVGGQPGCGKTELIDRVSKSLDNNILICNADELRRYHPDYDRIMQENELDFPTITWPLASKWNRQLIELGLEKKFNVLIETTLQDKGMVRTTIHDIKAKGYITHLHVLAVPKRISWLGIHLRYEGQKYDSGYGRTVSGTDHDDRFKKLVENFPDIVQCEDLDHVSVFSRQPLMKLDSTSPIVNVASAKEVAVDAFMNAIEKKMDMDEKTTYYEGCSRVIDFMRKRAAPEMDIQLFEEKAQNLSRDNN